jgi:hypothetical protein
MLPMLPSLDAGASPELLPNHEITPFCPIFSPLFLSTSSRSGGRTSKRAGRLAQALWPVAASTFEDVRFRATIPLGARRRLTAKPSLSSGTRGPRLRWGRPGVWPRTWVTDQTGDIGNTSRLVVEGRWPRRRLRREPGGRPKELPREYFIHKACPLRRRSARSAPRRNTLPTARRHIHRDLPPRHAVLRSRKSPSGENRSPLRG